MPTAPLLLRASDLPAWWLTSPALPQSIEVIVREGLLPGRNVVSRDRRGERPPLE